MRAYCGIDVACAKGKALPVAVAVREGTRLRTLPLRGQGPPPPRGMGNCGAVEPSLCASFAEATAVYLQAVEATFRVEIVEVAIDAPREPSRGQRRLAELAMDRMGVSCIPTPSESRFAEIRRKVADHLAGGGRAACLPHANQLWMLVGFALFRRLSERYRCIEVFPNAIVRSIAPVAGHKATAAGFETQLAAFAAAAGWDRDELHHAAHGTRHDRLDAVMSAWIASLPADRRVAYGDGHLDTIWSVGP
jgi:predicted nuclease with RNAse H fold